MSLGLIAEVDDWAGAEMRTGLEGRSDKTHLPSPMCMSQVCESAGSEMWLPGPGGGGQSYIPAEVHDGLGMSPSPRA